MVLQEQSQVPSMEQARTHQMYPAARELVPKIRRVGAIPIFLVTWAHRGGWPEQGMNDYGNMQAQINNGYATIAQELNAPMAPVGTAWASAMQGHPELSLWQEDGSHPSEQGTYLAACVFYAAIFQESPVGLTYQGKLSKEITQTLQMVASQTVLKIP